MDWWGDQGLCKGFRWPSRWWVNMSSLWDMWGQKTDGRLGEAGNHQEEILQYHVWISSRFWRLHFRKAMEKWKQQPVLVLVLAGWSPEQAGARAVIVWWTLRHFVLVRRVLCWRGAASVQIRRLCCEVEAQAWGQRLFSRVFLLVRKIKTSVEKSN